MKSFFSIILLVSYFSTFSQSKDYNIVFKDQFYAIGLNEFTKDSILAQDISFGYDLIDFHLDTSTGILLSYLQYVNTDGDATKHHLIAAWSLSEGKVLWTKKINPKNTQYMFLGTKTYINENQTCGEIYLPTNEFVWKKRGSIFLHPDLSKKDLLLGIGIKESKIIQEDSTYFKQKVQYDLSILDVNGIIKRSYDDINIKDDIIDNGYLSSNGNFLFFNEKMYIISLDTNNVYKSNSKFNEIRKTGNEFETNFTGLAIGIIFGNIAQSMYWSEIYNNRKDIKVNHMGSNLITQDSFFFVASTDSLFKIKYDGKIIGSIGISRNDNYKKLIEIEKSLYLIQYSREEVEKGSTISSFLSPPSITKYNYDLISDTSIVITNSNHTFSYDFGSIKDIMVENGEFIILMNNGFVCIDTNFSVLKTRKMKSNESIPLTQFFNKNYFIEYGERLVSDTLHNVYNLLSEDLSIAQYQKKDFTPKNRLKKYQYYESIYQDDKIKVLRNHAIGNAFITTLSGDKIIEMQKLKRIERHGDQLYIGLLNGYFVIKIDQLVR